jgi:HPt (histidine-containing phosphotransfer) domain-containing protein
LTAGRWTPRIRGAGSPPAARGRWDDPVLDSADAPTDDGAVVKDDDVEVEDVVDDRELLARVDDDRGLLEKLIALFFEEAPRVLAEVKRAVAAQDFPEVERAAHRMAGMLLNLAAHPASAAARSLELSARRQDLTDATTLVSQLERGVAAVSAHFTPPPR